MVLDNILSLNHFIASVCISNLITRAGDGKALLMVNKTNEYLSALAVVVNTVTSLHLNLHKNSNLKNMTKACFCLFAWTM